MGCRITVAEGTMSSESEQQRTKSLVRCPECESRLIYPADLAALEADAVIDRRCPECEHRDTVVASRLAAMLWFEKLLRTRVELTALRDALADGLPVEADLACGPARR
jgi:DNA-directed RNA polymerase subunit RPC12/RpoP